MKNNRALLPCFCALALTGCSSDSQSATGRLLMTPFNLMGGVLKAAGRTVTQNEADPTSEAAIAARGAAIERSGDYLGSRAAPVTGSPSENVTQR